MDTKSGVKQVCFLTPSLLGIFYALLLLSAFCDRHVSVSMQPPDEPEWRVVTHKPFATKTRLLEVLIRELIFADIMVPMGHNKEDLQEVISHFTRCHYELGLVIGLKNYFRSYLQINCTCYHHPKRYTI